MQHRTTATASAPASAPQRPQSWEPSGALSGKKSKRAPKAMDRFPPFKALRAFEAMIRCGSIKKAAEDLHVSPGAISQQIRKLETELGHNLFVREARAMRPTPAALELAAEVSRAFAAISTATKRFGPTKRPDPLRIATLPSVATRIVVPELSAFRRHAPEVQLSFTYVHRLEDFSLRNADVLLCVVDGMYRNEGTARILFDGAVAPVASPGYIETRGSLDEPSAMLKGDLLHDFDTSAWRRWFNQAGVEATDPLPGDIYEDFGLLIHAALSGQGIALCPPELISRELDSGQLTLLSRLTVLDERKYCIILPDDPRSDAFVFGDWLVELTAHRRSTVPDVKAGDQVSV
jgi:LysR family transcriptional regulator, glycine cleavage system transcriptional activator